MTDSDETKLESNCTLDHKVSKKHFDPRIVHNLAGKTFLKLKFFHAFQVHTAQKKKVCYRDAFREFSLLKLRKENFCEFSVFLNGARHFAACSRIL